MVHLDRLVFGPGWTPVDNAAARAALEARLAGGRWIVEGVYPQLNDLTLAKADLAIWLDQPAGRRLWRSGARRSDTTFGRAPTAGGCDEVFGWADVRGLDGEDRAFAGANGRNR